MRQSFTSTNIRTMGSEADHNRYLTNLEFHLDLVGESREDIVTVLKEPVWYKPGSAREESLCDIIIGYEDYYIPLELKGCRNKKSKAVKQLRQGHKFIDTILQRENGDYGLFVVYKNQAYTYERIRGLYEPV